MGGWLGGARQAVRLPQQAAACVSPLLQVTRGLKPTPYQNPETTIGQPTIVIIPEHKEAAPGPKVGWGQAAGGKHRQGCHGCVLASSICPPGSRQAATPTRALRHPPTPAPPNCLPACLQEHGIRLFTCHVRRGAPDVQDPGWNSHSKLNCIVACIQASGGLTGNRPRHSTQSQASACSTCWFCVVGSSSKVWGI